MGQNGKIGMQRPFKRSRALVQMHLVYLRLWFLTSYNVGVVGRGIIKITKIYTIPGKGMLWGDVCAGIT